MAEPRISAVIPVFNRISTLRQSLDSIVHAARVCGDVELVFVDHGSTDGSYEVLLDYASAVVLQCRGGQISAVRNLGARRARGDILSFIDCDIVVPPSYFVSLRQVFAETGAQAAGRECGLPADPHWVERVWHDANVRGTDGIRHYINSGNFAVRRSAFDAVGGFPEELETGEDTELCRRLTEAGFCIWESQALDVAHLGNPKSLRAFFRKQIWHGLGMFGGHGSPVLNKPAYMTLCHIGLLLVAAGCLMLVAFRGGMLLLSSAVLLPQVVPASTIAFRAVQLRRIPNLPLALILFHTFYLARAIAAVRALRVLMNESAPETPPASRSTLPVQ